MGLERFSQRSCTCQTTTLLLHHISRPGSTDCIDTRSHCPGWPRTPTTERAGFETIILLPSLKLQISTARPWQILTFAFKILNMKMTCSIQLLLLFVFCFHFEILGFGTILHQCVFSCLLTWARIILRLCDGSNTEHFHLCWVTLQYLKKQTSKL